MAVTFHQQPNNYTPSDNPILYVFSSNQTSQANFSYIVETRIDGVLVSTDRVFPEVSGRAHWDASTVVKTNIYKPTRSTVLLYGITLPVVQVTVIENYGTPAINHSSASSTGKYVFKSKLDEEEWKTKNFLTTYVDKKFLTDIPNSTIYATREQDIFAQILSASSVALTFSFYDSDGVLLDLYSSGSALNTLWNINASYSNLLDVYPGLDETCKSVEIALGDSELLIINYIDDDCLQKNVISWINKYGSFDQFVFTHNLENKGSVESQYYEKMFGGWDGSTYSYNVPYGSIETVKVINPTGYIVTGWLTKEVQNWLVTLYKSIGVRLNNEVSIRITSSSYTEKTNRFEELINEEITYALTSTKSMMI